MALNVLESALSSFDRKERKSLTVHTLQSVSKNAMSCGTIGVYTYSLHHYSSKLLIGSSIRLSLLQRPIPPPAVSFCLSSCARNRLTDGGSTKSPLGNGRRINTV